jgi:hypothetical protein
MFELGIGEQAQRQKDDDDDESAAGGLGQSVSLVGVKAINLAFGQARGNTGSL